MKMYVAMGADHGGIAPKNELVAHLGDRYDIVGLGAHHFHPDDDYPDVTQEVAQRAAKGMGMNILYFDIKRNHQFEQAYQAKFAELDFIIREADFITIHVPLLPTTKHLIGAKEFRMMKKTAYLINTSRGPIIDERALVEALKKRGIAGAALDVYEFEPNLSTGLERLDNVILTPHTASGTYETRSAMAELAAMNILEVLKGKTPPNLVNKEVEQFIDKEPLLD